MLIVEHGRGVEYGALSQLTSRPDVPFLRDAVGLGSVFDAVVTRVDAERGLAALQFGGGELFVPARAGMVGTLVRVRIPAREVILAVGPPQGLSLHNVLAGRIAAMHIEPTSDVVIVRIQVGDEFVLSEVTRDAVHRLHLAVHQRVCALVKSVSIEVKQTSRT
jgi:molybdate transport system ATP-binding protein